MTGFLRKEEAAALAQALPLMSKKEKKELLDMLDAREQQAKLASARSSVLAFAHNIYPGFKEGPHHRRLAKIFDAVVSGEKKRVIINIAPRMGKSEFSSYILPAYYLGRFPDKKIIMGTHTASLSEDFGRRVRNLITTEEYSTIFPDTTISEDQKSAGKWSTDAHGQYYAVGVGGALAGRGADLLLVDDPHSEQDIKTGTRTPFDAAWSWFQTGPLQRLMPGGAVVVIMTRWSKLDLTARLLDHQMKNPDSDRWEIVELPAIMGEGTDAEKSLWPEQWPLEQLQMKRAGMDPRYWQAQYMQQPTSDIAALIKRESWKTWEKAEPPKCDYIIQSWDTAHETKTTSDYSACIVWGVWFNEEDKDKGEDGNANIIMLDAIKNRWAFPDLKKRAMDYYNEWEPDACLIEKKAAGAPLIQELRAMGIAVSEFSPSRGRVGVSNDKIARLNSISDMFASGKVWAPDTRWAREVIEEVASFPSGEHDDYVDCCFFGTRITMADGTLRAIQTLKPGDFVATPGGSRRVLACAFTGVRPLWEVRADGRTLFATGNHPMCLSGGIYGRIDTLPQTAELRCHSRVRFQMLTLKSWFLRATAIVGIQKAATQHIVGTLAAQASCCIGSYGNTTMAPSPQVGTFTTSTSARLTTGWKTLSAFLRKNIGARNMPTEKSEVVVARNWRTWLRFVTVAKRGTLLKKVVHGTAKTPSDRHKREKMPDLPRLGSTLGLLGQLFAAGVVRLSRRGVQSPCFADLLVKQKNRDTVCEASVLSTQRIGAVFNLSVEGEHCFYAEGFLTHNCTVQALMRLRAGGFIRLPSDEKDEPRYFKSSRNAAYY